MLDIDYDEVQYDPETKSWVGRMLGEGWEELPPRLQSRDEIHHDEDSGGWKGADHFDTGVVGVDGKKYDIYTGELK